MFRNAQLLHSLVTDKISKLQQNENFHNLVSEISFLIQIISRFLADDPKGESPMIPLCFKMCSKETQNDHDDPCYFLPQQIFSITKIYCEWIAKEIQFPSCLSFSLIEFYSRWCFSYLFCKEKSYEKNHLFVSPRLLSQFSDQNGFMLLDSIFHFSIQSIFFFIKNQWEDCLSLLCHFLVQLASSSFICPFAKSVPSFQSFLSIFIHDQMSPCPVLLNFSNGNLRKFSRSIFLFSYLSEFDCHKIMNMIEVGCFPFYFAFLCLTFLHDSKTLFP